MAADEWRPMRASDLAAVTTISDAVHGRFTEPMAVYAERFALWPDGCRVLEQDGEVTGYLVTHPWHRGDPPALGALLGAIPAAETCYLHDVALLPSARGIGAGKAALAFVAAHARELGFADITLVAVGGADRFWAAQGFGYVAGVTSYGEGTHLMRMPV